MLPLIVGFPAAFIGAFFTGSLLIETLFSLDGLGCCRTNRCAARLSGRARHAVPVHADRSGDQARLRPLLRVVDPRIQFENLER
jgi:microcin C transport system permease protein